MKDKDVITDRRCCQGYSQGTLGDNELFRTRNTRLPEWGVSQIHLEVLKDIHNIDGREEVRGDQLVVEVIHKWGTIEIHADGRIVTTQKDVIPGNAVVSIEDGCAQMTTHWRPPE